MDVYRNISQNFVKSLSLRYEPVGVDLYQDTDSLPTDIPLTQKELKSYCQALVLAGEGQIFLLGKEQMGCKLGTSVLGFETNKDMEAYLDDGVLEKYGVGLFDSEEAPLKQFSSQCIWKKAKPRLLSSPPCLNFNKGHRL